jgi:hypothetical protein
MLDAPDPGDVVEIPLLLNNSEVLALEQAAHARGLTAAEMLRMVLRRFIQSVQPTLRDA